MPKKPKIILFSDLTEDINIEEYTSFEQDIFSKELEIYKENLLKTLMDLICTEIDRLPKTQKDVLFIYYFQEKSISQTAKLLNIPSSAVALRKHRAICTLKKRLLSNPYAVELYKKIKELDPTFKILLEIDPDNP